MNGEPMPTPTEQYAPAEERGAMHADAAMLVADAFDATRTGPLSADGKVLRAMRLARMSQMTLEELIHALGAVAFDRPAVPSTPASTTPPPPAMPRPAPPVRRGPITWAPNYAAAPLRFGQYKNRPLSAVPSQYLRFLLSTGKLFPQTLRDVTAELERRRAATPARSLE